MRQAIAVLAGACVLAGCASTPDRSAEQDTDAVEPVLLEPVAAIHVAEAGEATPVAADGEQAGELRCIDTAFTGSRIPRRLCLTEAQWERWRLDSQEMLREWQGPKTSGPN